MKPSARSLSELWAEYAADCLGDVEEIQRSEMRRAFYCGATVTLSTMLGANKLAPGLAMVEVNALKAEILAWNQEELAEKMKGNE